MTDSWSREEDEDSILAAEYVIGVLPHGEREAFKSRLAVSRSLQERVRYWEEHFLGLARETQPISPPARLLPAIEARLFPESTRAVGGWQSLLFWRSLSAANFAALMVMLALYGLRPATDGAQPAYVGELSSPGNAVRLVTLYDPARGTLKFNRLTGQPAANRAFQLWAIEGSNRPVSLGVLPGSESGAFTIPAALRAAMANSVLAISDEPAGGSPTGQPTGAVVATGKLNAI